MVTKVSLLALQIAAIYVHIILRCCASEIKVCDRRPLGTTTEPLPPDNQFVLEIEGIRENNKYIPSTKYTVHLKSRDERSTFIAFTIALREDTMANTNNPRKPILLQPGELEPFPLDNQVKLHPDCKRTVMESDVTAKTAVSAQWTAPAKNNKCVTIFALVAVRSNVWYSFEGPLSKQVCEDQREDDDIPPQEVDDCKVCDDARYQLTFQGLWSYNTHPTMFPATHELARFSDIVGASHAKGYSAFTLNSIASLGLKMLAEQGNTTQLEKEIEEHLASNVRTVIKANAPPKPNMSTMAILRASRKHHRLSLLVGILPSPDWFLGVSSLELCDTDGHQWRSSVRLNLYPFDAGTDKGLTFESPNEEMSPQQPISRAVIGKDRQGSKAFARLLLTLVRTYNNPDCVTESDIDDQEEAEENNEEEDKGEEEDGEEEVEEPSVVVYKPSTTSEEPQIQDPDSTDRCPVTQWQEWLPCEGECVEGALRGAHIRLRYHIVDGRPVGEYVEGKYQEDEAEIPQECLDEFPDSETEMCEEPCEEETHMEEEDEEGEEQADDY